MAYMIDPELLKLAFSGGSVGSGGHRLTFRTKSVGKLVVLSGHVCASDPLVCPDPQPYTRMVPTGEHPVSLAIAVRKSGDERTAFARVDFDTGEVARWEMALVEGQNPDELTDTEIYGYGVDAGTGCFMDAVTSKFLTERMGEKEDYYEDIIGLLERTYKHTRSWANFKPREEEKGNVVAFSTGYGDGMYASYFGIASDERPICLVTDFGVVDVQEHDETEEEAPAPLSDSTRSAKPWWRFW